MDIISIADYDKMSRNNKNHPYCRMVFVKYYLLSVASFTADRVMPMRMKKANMTLG